MNQVPLLALGMCASAALLWAQSDIVVVNGASYASPFPVAPGSYAQIFGALNGIIPNADANLAELPLPDTLEGVRVQVEGVAAPLYAVRANVSGDRDSIAFIVPQSTQPGRRTVLITVDGQIAGQATMDVVPSSPGIFFARSAEGLDVGGVLNQSNAFAVEATPAKRGEVIQIYLTGQGTDLSSAVPDGNVPSASTLATTTTAPEVYISAEKARVQFSGVHSRFPGLWQVNVIVPDKPYIRGPVPLRVSMNGVVSNLVVFWVAE